MHTLRAYHATSGDLLKTYRTFVLWGIGLCEFVGGVLGFHRFVGCTLVVRWLFVGCSLVVRWLFAFLFQFIVVSIISMLSFLFVATVVAVCTRRNDNIEMVGVTIN